MRTWQQSETVPIKALCYDEDDALYSPDQGLLITITDPDETAQIEDTPMTESSTGDFRYEYTLGAAATKGWWRYRITAQDGSGGSAVYVIADEGFMAQ